MNYSKFKYSMYILICISMYTIVGVYVRADIYSVGVYDRTIIIKFLKFLLREQETMYLWYITIVYDRKKTPLAYAYTV